MTNVGPWDAPGRFYKGNLHCHSTLSDGVQPLETVVNEYKAQQYDFLAVSEHWLIAETRPFDTGNFVTLTAVELDAPICGDGPYRFINATGLPHDFPLERGETLPEIAKRARDAGALVTIACPAWCGTTTDDVLAVGVAHAVETYSETCEQMNSRGSSWHLVDQAADRGVRLNGLAVDDSHTPLDRFGGWAMVKAASLSAGALLEALKRGDYYHTQGPEIFDLRITESTLKIACSPTSAIRLSGLGWAGDGQQGSRLTHASLPLEHFVGGYVRVTIVDRYGRQAWTNPIWLD